MLLFLRRNLDVRFGPEGECSSPPTRASSLANNADDGSTYLLKVSNFIQARHCVAYDPRAEVALAGEADVIALPASDFMRQHPAFDRYRESYPRRSELHQNYYSGDGDEQNAVPDGV